MVDMATIEGLCKRRGFIYRSSEIYGGFNGFFDYGPLGVELKNNIKRAWWNDFVHGRDDIVGLDASIIMHPDVWRASGHVAGFSDPMVDCKESKLRFRADQIFFAEVKVDGETIGYVSVLEDENMQTDAEKRRRNSNASSRVRANSAKSSSKTTWTQSHLSTTSFPRRNGQRRHAHAAARLQPHVPDIRRRNARRNGNRPTSAPKPRRAFLPTSKTSATPRA